eukprot:ANDGO_05976.mRNA.1 G2/mitotic-specific cyclin S13-7
MSSVVQDVDLVTSMRAKELRTPKLEMRNQRYQRCRSRLVNWMCDMCTHFDVSKSTYYSSVFITDSILSREHIDPQRYQLVSIASILISSKYEDLARNVLRVSDLEVWCKGLYREQQIVRMESYILSKLDWNVGVLTVAHFLNVFLPFVFKNGADDYMNGRQLTAEEKQGVTRKIQRLSVMIPSNDAIIVSHRASVIAASVIYFARRTSKMLGWPSSLALFAEYTEEELIDCSMCLQTLYKTRYNLEELISPDTVIEAAAL